MPSAPGRDISPTTVRCTACGYDLSGSTIGGTCPECGTPVHQSLKPLLAERPCSTATASMVCGILSLVLCIPFGPLAIILAVMARREMRRAAYTASSHIEARAGLVLGMVGTGAFLYFAVRLLVL